MFFLKGSQGIQIINFVFSFILLLEVCLKVSKSERFINWIGENWKNHLEFL